MIELMKYTYLMEPEKVEAELEKLWNRYQTIINQENTTWEEMNEARAILFLTWHIYCEEIAVAAIERRIHLLPEQFSLIDFFMVIDSNSERLDYLRKHKLFNKLERYYNIIKNYKNNHVEGKYYLEEEKFLKRYKKLSPNQDMRIGYQWSFEIKQKKASE